MNLIKRILVSAGIIFTVICFVFICGFSVDTKTQLNGATDSGSAARGIYTSLTIKINTENSDVQLIVKNDITIFSSAVRVRAELYSSLTYKSNYEDMTLAGYAYTNDLDMGDSLIVTASTEGLIQFWFGRVEYKVDNKNWVTELTSIYKISGNGEYIE